MTAIYADSGGHVLSFDSTLPPPQPIAQPVGTTFSADFDPSANHSLVVALLDGLVTLPANNAPLINGVPYTIQPASSDYQTLTLVRQAITTLKGTETLPNLSTIAAAIQAVQAGNATNAQAQLALAVTMRLLGLLAQRLLNNGTLG